MGQRLSVQKASGITRDCVTWVWSTVFLIRPTNQRNTAQGLFKEGPCAGPQPTRARHFLKILRATLDFPLKGAPQVPGNKTPPPTEGGKSLAGQPFEAWWISSDQALRAVQSTTRPAEVWPTNWRGAPNTGVWPAPLTCIYGGGRVHYVEGTTKAQLIYQYWINFTRKESVNLV